MEEYSNKNAALKQVREAYLMKDSVVVINEYPVFGLCRIRYVDNGEELIIASNVLTENPNRDHTISIRCLGGRSR